MNRSNRRAKKSRRSAAGPWTAERIALLQTRWSQGASARRISKELGDGFTRCAVLGKIHRLGIAQLSPYAGAGKKPTAAEQRHAHEHGLRRMAGRPAGKPHPWEQWSVPAWVKDAEPCVVDPLADAAIPLSQRRSLPELDHRTCRWPIGEPGSPDFWFCGAQPLPGKSYCAVHCTRAYRLDEDTMPPATKADARASALGFRAADARTAPADEPATERRLIGKGR